MKYKKVVSAIFIDRPNRFIAHVRLNGQKEGILPDSSDVSKPTGPSPQGRGKAHATRPWEEIETVHVKNTGRCRELLTPGATVYLAEADNPARKTRYDLIAVVKASTGVLFNMDSQAPNQVVKEWLQTQGFSRIVPEYTHGNSRLDFYMEKDGEKYLLEVKGCTLERDGIGYFPDAPTERGTKHLRELTAAASAGYHAMVAFVIQMDGVSEVRANVDTDPAFADALWDAEAAGVKVLHLQCHVTPDRIEIKKAHR